MSSEIDPIVKSAIEWHVKLSSDNGDAWQAFAEWLAADPRHAQAYDRVEGLDGRLDALLPELELPAASAAPTAGPARRKFLYWGSGAVAASLLAALLWLPGGGTQRYEIATAPGETRVVQLDAATEVAVNGSTRIILDRLDPRYASLVSGQALFRVRHDESRPFIVQLGSARVVDFGTVFDITRVSDEIRLAVSEGEVEYQTQGERVPLAPGDQLRVRAGSEPVVSATPRAAVGAWQRGQLLYSEAPLSEVAADLSRTLGTPIEVAPSIADRPFSGNLTIGDTGTAELARLGPALDVTFRPMGAGWMMDPSRNARK